MAFYRSTLLVGWVIKISIVSEYSWILWTEINANHDKSFVNIRANKNKNLKFICMINSFNLSILYPVKFTKFKQFLISQRIKF